jgi:hypothetical protein
MPKARQYSLNAFEVNSLALSILIAFMLFFGKLARNRMIWAISFAKAWFHVDYRHMWFHRVEASISTMKYLKGPDRG